MSGARSCSVVHPITDARPQMAPRFRYPSLGRTRTVAQRTVDSTSPFYLRCGLLGWWVVAAGICLPSGYIKRVYSDTKQVAGATALLLLMYPARIFFAGHGVDSSGVAVGWLASGPHTSSRYLGRESQDDRSCPEGPLTPPSQPA